MDTVSSSNQTNWKPRFFTIWTGQAFSLLGSMLVSFAIIWWMTKTTGSATVLARASLAGLLPQILLGPIAGTLVDRWNRRVVMMVADSLIALATAVLAVLFLTNSVELWHVYTLLFIRSFVGSFHYSAMTASTTLMVPGEQLARVQGLNQMLHGAMNILSAPLGALLLEFMPIAGIMAIDVVTAMIAVVPLFFFSVPQPVRKIESGAPQRRTSVWQEFKEGFRYAFSWPGLMIIGAMAALINLLLNSGFTLMPILVTNHFNGQAFHLAWLESGFGIGFVLGGLLLSIWGGFKKRIVTAMIGLFGLGLGTLFLGFIPAGYFPLAVAAMFWLGFVNPITNGPLLAAVQATVAPEMQGRIFTLLNSVAQAMMPIGLLIAGPVADRFGIQTWFILGGIVTLAMAILSFFIPAVMNFEKGRNGNSLEQEKLTEQAPIEINPGD
jgi:DHA3 family macrolide efflux protein-like MFS transporter